MMKHRGIALLFAMAVSACAPLYAPPPQLPEHAVTLHMSYPQAFDRVLHTLEEEGYQIAIADRERGFIETRPKAVKSAAEKNDPFDYHTVVTARVGGSWRESWAVVNVVVLQGYPNERDRVMNRLREGLSRSGDDR